MSGVLSNIVVGDKVAYSKKFLQSTGQLTGVVPFARGIVKEVHVYGRNNPLHSSYIAVVDWGVDKDEVPDRVNIVNLVRVTEKGLTHPGKEKQ